MSATLRYPAFYAHWRKIAPIPIGEWRRFEALLSPWTLRKKDFFVRTGERTHSFAIVLSGLVRMYYVDKKGRELTRAFRGPGQIAGAFSDLLLARPSRVCIQALNDAQLLTANYNDFSKLYSRHQAWQELGRKFAEQLYLVKEQREFEFLMLTDRERWQAFSRDHAELARQIPQYHIASYLGITPVALSRFRKKPH